MADSTAIVEATVIMEPSAAVSTPDVDALSGMLLPVSLSLTRQNSVPLLDCPVCYDIDIRKNLMVVFEPCGHTICRPCAVGLVRDKLVPNCTGVFCPVCTSLLQEAPHTHTAPITHDEHTITTTTDAPAGAGVDAAVDIALLPPPAPATHRLESTGRAVVGQLTESYMRRLQAWSARPTTKLPQTIRALTVDDVKRFVAVMIESAVRHMDRKTGKGEKTLRCPSASCGLLFIIDTCAAPTGHCPYCNGELCIGCGQVWGPAHVGRSCAAAAEVARNAMLDDLLIRRQGNTFRSCPSCAEAITHYHNHGCHHMTCNCGAYFCYTCGQELYSAEGEPHDDEACVQFCTDECACPPCPECRRRAAFGEGGCEVCDGDCRACLGQVDASAWADDDDVTKDDGPTAESLGHTGAWRPQLGAYWCSLPETPDGPRCNHVPRIIEMPHWSCCGETARLHACKVKASAS